MDLVDAKRILASKSLSSFNFGDFLIVTNSDFDVTISGEPYLALMLLYDLKSGTNCIKIGLLGKLILSKRKGLREARIEPGCRFSLDKEVGDCLSSS